MPQAQVYLSEVEYGKFLREAERKGITLSKHLAEKIRRCRP